MFPRLGQLALLWYVPNDVLKFPTCNELMDAENAGSISPVCMHCSALALSNSSPISPRFLGIAMLDEYL